MTIRPTHDRALTLVAGIGCALLLALAAPSGGTLAAAAQPPVSAATVAAPVEGIWQRHEQTFTFAGFTSHYSCEGLADKLKLLLQDAGARDVKAVGGGCFGPGGTEGPSRISSARLTFYTLAPVAAAAPAAPSKPAAAPAREIGRKAPLLGKKAEPQAGVGAWKTVKWSARSPRELDEGDCELVEQFARELLPAFTTRNVDSHMSCTPHQLSLGGVNLKFESLAGLPEPEQPAARQR